MPIQEEIWLSEALSCAPHSVSPQQMPSTQGASLAVKDKEPYIQSLSSQDNCMVICWMMDQKDVDFGSKEAKSKLTGREGATWHWR